MSRRSTLTVTTLQILLSLADGPRHGYGIKLDVEDRTDGQIKLGSGTLYEAIQRLEANGWIETAEGPTPENDREGKRYYALTEAGFTVLRRELGKLDDMVRYARGIDLLAEEGGS